MDSSNHRSGRVQSRRLESRRAITAPLSAPTRPATTSQSIETLYTHPSVKIVTFTAGPGRGATAAEVESGSLFWTSQLERTIAVGPLHIYRAPGSVAFLNCGSALQPILPKSQCWCVDTESRKYVLQIRRPQYWRIEIATAAAENMHRANLLRDVLDKVLQFEKTECPFRRTFTVELPQRPQGPVQKRPWRPVKPTDATLPPTPTMPCDGALTRMRPRKQELQIEGLNSASTDCATESQKLLSRNAQEQAAAEFPGVKAAQESKTPELSAAEDVSESGEQNQSPNMFAHAAVPNGFHASRVVTAPPHLFLVTSPPSKSRKLSLPSSEASLTEAESHASFRGVQAWHSPITPLPMSSSTSDPDTFLTYSLSHGNLVLSGRLKQPCEQSGTTASPDTPNSWTVSSSRATVSTSPLAPCSACEARVPMVAESCLGPQTPAEEATPTTTTSTALVRCFQARHRATTSVSISHSQPLPSATELMRSARHVQSTSTSATVTSRASQLTTAVRRLPLVVLFKTCEVVFGPPAHLINLMLQVAAKITAGQWRGNLFGYEKGRESIALRWNLGKWSDEDDDGEGEPGGGVYDEDFYLASASARGPYWGFSSSDGIGKMAGTFPSSDDEASDAGDALQRASPKRSSMLIAEDAAADTHEGFDALLIETLTDAEWARSWDVD